MNVDIKSVKTDTLAVVFFAIVSLLYCYPQLQGKILKQYDNLNWQGMAREGMAYHDSTGHDVLWSNSMFGGMPTYTHYVAVRNTNYAYYIQVFFQSVGKPAYFFFIAMACFYLLVRVIGLNNRLGILGAIAFAFSSYNPIIIGVGHDTKMLTIAYLPAAFAGLYLVYRQKWLAGAAILGLSMALIFSNSHFQVIYYAFIVFGCFGLYMAYEAVKTRKIKQFVISTAVAVAAIAIGIGPTVPSILTTTEFAKETMRGGASKLAGHDQVKTNGGLDKEYAFRWSSGIGETFCIMIPFLYGGATYDAADMAPKTSEALGGNTEVLPTYWGEQPTQMGPVYFGAVICFLFVLGLLVIQSLHKWWILSACFIGIVLSWGKNLPAINYFLFDHMPYLNKFRTVEMAMIIPEFLFPLLAVWCMQEVLDKKNDTARLLKNVKVAAGITAGLCLLIGVGGSMYYSFTGWRDANLQPEILKLLKEDRAHLTMVSSLKSTVYILITAGLLWAFINNKIKSVILVAGVGVLIGIDLISVAHNYLSDRNYVDAADYESSFSPRDVDKQILKDPDPYYRVLDLSTDLYNDAMQAYFHKCIGGYHPAKLEIYQDLIDRQMSRGFNGQVLNMLNTKYIIVGGQKRPPSVIPNPAACGNAWFVNDVKWVNTAEEEMNSLNAPAIGDTLMVPGAFNPRQAAVIQSSFKNDFGNYAFGKDSAAYIKLDKYGLDDISFKSGNSKDGLAVFSDIYYAAGWKAYVDGKETPIMKADYVLRAVKIPAGSHNIEFHFRPASFYNGQKIALASSFMLIALSACAFIPLFKKRAMSSD